MRWTFTTESCTKIFHFKSLQCYPVLLSKQRRLVGLKQYWQYSICAWLTWIHFQVLCMCDYSKTQIQTDKSNTCSASLTCMFLSGPTQESIWQTHFDASPKLSVRLLVLDIWLPPHFNNRIGNLNRNQQMCYQILYTF